MQAVNWMLAWSVMSLVMMVPTAVRPALRLSGGRVGRWLAFLVSYGAIWMSTAVLAYPIDRLIPWNGATILLGWALVGGYGMLPSTMRHLRSCRLLTAQANPWQAGAKYALNCSIACLPMMIMSMATIHELGLSFPATLGAMAVLSAVIMWAKHPGVPRSYVRGAGATVTAFAVLAFTLGMSPLPGDAQPGHGHGGENGAGTR